MPNKKIDKPEVAIKVEKDVAKSSNKQIHDSKATMTQEIKKTDTYSLKDRKGKKSFKDLRFKDVKNFFGLNGRLTMLLPFIIMAIFFIVTPTILLVVKAATPVDAQFDNWQLIKDSSTWQIMGRSVSLGLVSALCALVIGLPFAYFVSTNKSKLIRTAAISLIVSPLFIFTIAKALSLRGLMISMFDSPEAIDNYFVVVVGLTYLNLPFMIIPIYSVFSTMPKSLLEASADLGNNGVKTIFKVVIPYGFKAIASGFALVFMLSATSIIISDKLLTDGSQFRMIGNVINEVAHPNNPFEIAQASTVAIITIAIMSSIYLMIYLLPTLIRKLRGGVNV